MDDVLPDFDLSGQVALVTGASRGLGRGIAEALAFSGVRVAAAGRDARLLDELVTEIETAGGEAVATPFDVTDVESIHRAVASVVARFGRLDILVANAGLGDNRPALEVTEAEWDAMMDVNLRGLFFSCQAAARTMVEQGYGRIVTMSSQAGVVGIRDHAVYSASKGGVNMLVKVMALEWAPYGVTVNAVAPTFVYTPGTAERLDDPDYLEGVVSRIPAGRVASMADIAGAVMYLASPAAGMVNGTVLLVDGGWTAQ
jgi:2-deoxy-D-gluconate 3-dehydrogenase